MYIHTNLDTLTKLLLEIVYGSRKNLPIFLLILLHLVKSVNQTRWNKISYHLTSYLGKTSITYSNTQNTYWNIILRVWSFSFHGSDLTMGLWCPGQGGNTFFSYTAKNCPTQATPHIVKNSSFHFRQYHWFALTLCLPGRHLSITQLISIIKNTFNYQLTIISLFKLFNSTKTSIKWICQNIHN